MGTSIAEEPKAETVANSEQQSAIEEAPHINEQQQVEQATNMEHPTPTAGKPPATEKPLEQSIASTPIEEPNEDWLKDSPEEEESLVISNKEQPIEHAKEEDTPAEPHVDHLIDSVPKEVVTIE